jgi:sterol desaturase/sphingolipid hydroxylase (fatty acid hydroxylase superfamily)
LIGVSLFFWILEIVIPWRKNQPIIRKDFWLDAFYMFFNFFLFSLIGWKAVQDIFVNLLNDFLALFGIENMVAVQIGALPVWAHFLLLFIVGGFLSWCVHRLLHRVPALWEFHKVHHSVEQMGFAAHLRYHWMENVIYWGLKYIPLTILGFNLLDLFILHIFNLAVGHFNHANIRVPLGPLKYVFNNPQMHIWHHAQNIDWKGKHRYGVNFGITLSIWDYLFGTDYIPESGRDEPLGFPKVESFPHHFMAQIAYPWAKKKPAE